MDAVYPLANKRAISRSLLTLDLVEDRLPKHPYHLVVKCVAVIREFYRKSVKSRVSVVGRREVREEVVETALDGVTEGNVASEACIGGHGTVYNYMLIFVLLFCYVHREFNNF